MSEINQYILDWIEFLQGRDHSGIFPAYVRIMRQKKKLTRSETARRTQISVATLLAIENGLISHEDLSKADIQNLENCLGVSFHYFWKRYIMLENGSVDGQNKDAK